MKLTSRQKVLIPIIILAFLYIAWQVFDMFFAGSDTTPAPAVQPITAPQPATQTATAQPTGVSTPASAIQPAAPQVVAPQKKDVSQLKMGTDSKEQSAFANLMKQYQDLQAKRMLLQEEVTIAQTRHKIAELNAKLAQLGVSAGSSAAKARSHSSGYSLMYIDHQRGRWSAILSKDGTPHSVKVGARLPNNIRVTSVNKYGVIIKHSGKYTRLTFGGPIEITRPPVIESIKTSVKTTKPKPHHYPVYKPAKLTMPAVKRHQIHVKITPQTKKATPVVIPQILQPKKIVTQKTPTLRNNYNKVLMLPEPATPTKKIVGLANGLPQGKSVASPIMKPAPKVLKVDTSKTSTFTVQAVKKPVPVKPTFKVTATPKPQPVKPTFKTQTIAPTTKQPMGTSVMQPTPAPAIQSSKTKSAHQPSFKVKQLQPKLIINGQKRTAEQPIRLSPYRTKTKNNGLVNSQVLY